MNGQKSFQLKDDETKEIRFSADEIEDIVPDADMRFSLVILTNGDKHFVCGTDRDIREKLDG
jgi:hypothetical protein